MNRPIVRTYIFVLLLFGLLVYFTSRWAVIDAADLESNSQNRRALIESAQVERGSIATSDGVVIAESTPSGGRDPVYERSYPGGALYANPVGTSFIETGQTGLERSEDNLLTGEENEFASLVDQLQDEQQAGADLTLTINSETQRVATEALQNALATTAGTTGAGSVVAIEPSTGAVRAMVSLPSYDPGTLPAGFDELNADRSAPLLNRPTQSRYPPGSTFKVISAAAALDSGQFETTTTLNANSGIEIGGVPLANSGDFNPGTIDMTYALTNSVNTYWAQVGEQLGSETMLEYMRRFGFESDPELDYPDDQMTPSGIVDLENDGALLNENDPIDIGRVAIGQERLLATPLQMAEVAATIANGGSLMEPTLLQEAKDPDGRTIAELDPTEQEQVVSEETAAQVATMMTNVANEGTASSLSVPGSTFAGKTGTAEIDVEAGTNRPWFIGFAPADDPQVAIAVMLEQCQGCFGGDASGPVATQVMEAVLNE